METQYREEHKDERETEISWRLEEYYGFCGTFPIHIIYEEIMGNRLESGNLERQLER